MTADEAMRLAAFQRPGVRLIVGPTEAREERTEARALPADWRDSQPTSWREYDLRRRLGFIPSLWAFGWADAYKGITGREPTDAEWVWLHRRDGQGASLQDARAWLSKAEQEAVDDLKRQLEEMDE